MKLLALAAVATFASVASAATTIDFSVDAAGNMLSPGTTIADQYAAIGVRFVGSAFDEPGNPNDNFASNTDMRLAMAGGDTARDAIIPVGAGNFLHTYSGFTVENGDANFAIEFDAPVTSVSIDIYDDIAGLTQMFAIAGEEIVNDTKSFDSEDAAPQTLTVSSVQGFNVVAMVLGSNIDWVAVDNLSFTPIPEPATLIGGLAACGTIARRWRR